MILKRTLKFTKEGLWPVFACTVQHSGKQAKDDIWRACVQRDSSNLSRRWCTACPHCLFSRFEKCDKTCPPLDKELQKLLTLEEGKLACCRDELPYCLFKAELSALKPYTYKEQNELDRFHLCIFAHTYRLCMCIPVTNIVKKERL